MMKILIWILTKYLDFNFDFLRKSCIFDANNKIFLRKSCIFDANNKIFGF